MSKLKLMLASSFLALGVTSAAVACPGHEKVTKSEEKAPETATVAVFKVDGMHCDGCGDNIKSALAKTGGVYKVEVKSADGRVSVTFDKGKISAEQIAKIIGEAGYKATAEV